MRIAERLTRLELREGSHPRMTPAEIEMAATRYEQALVAEGDPLGRTIVEAVAAWRQMVAIAPTWAQRIYAHAEPIDLFL